jgi:tRNA(Ile)-lysidine synthase
MEKEFFVETKNKIVVAVSGGVDSVVLLDILAQLSESMQFNVYVAHFNHKLRDVASDRDEDFVKNIARDYNFQYFTASGNVKAFSEKNSVSIEHAARTLRYNFYERTSRTINAEYVATAHNANDNTETFFINLFRGSGLTGLSGIPACRQLVKNVRMIRPLINFAKKDIREYAAKRKLKWMEDDTNRLLDFTRNKIRLDLIPKIAAEYNPAIIEVVNRTSRLLNGIDHFVSEYVKNSIASVARDITTERYSLDIVALDTFEEVIQKEIIQGAWEKYFRTQPLSMMNIDKIMALKDSETGTIYNLNKNFEILKDRRKLIFFKKKAENRINLQIKGTGKFNIGKGTLVITEVKPDEVEYNDSRHVEYVDAGLLPMVLEARNWEEGDRFMPLGAPGEMLVSDFFINEKVPLIDKQSVLLLTNKVDIIWVIGYRINHKYKVDARSEKIYRLEYFKKDK